MKKIYFNHGILIGSVDSAVMASIVEIADIKEALGTISLCVSEDFWNLRIRSGTLFSFLTKRGNRDKAIVFILTLVFGDRPEGLHLEEKKGSVPGAGENMGGINRE